MTRFSVTRSAATRALCIAGLSLCLAATACDTTVDPVESADSAGDGDGDGDGPIDPTLANVQALFDGSCAGSICHVGTTSPGGSLDLSASTLCASTVGVEAAGASGQTLVVPGDADSSYLLCKMLDDCQKVGGLMPLGATSQLPAPELTLLRDWIDANAPGCE